MIDDEVISITNIILMCIYIPIGYLFFVKKLIKFKLVCRMYIMCKIVKALKSQYQHFLLLVRHFTLLIYKHFY